MTRPPPIILGLGELLWDCFPDGRRPGGAPANVAFQAGQLGCRGVVASRVGRDPLGDELLAFLAAQGVATDWVQRDAVYPTGRVTVDTSQPDRPSYVIHEDVAWDHLEATGALLELAGQSSAICFGTLAQRTASARRAIAAVLEAAGPQCLTVYDVNLRQRFFDRPWVEQSLARSRVVKLNSDEVRVLAGLLGLPSAELAFAQAIQSRFGTELVCVTRAEHGCLLLAGNEAVESPGVRVQVVDAVGAGDAFTAALIVARLRGWPVERQGSLANRVGALVASRAGAMPLLRDEFRLLLEQPS